MDAAGDASGRIELGLTGVAAAGTERGDVVKHPRIAAPAKGGEPGDLAWSFRLCGAEPAAHGRAACRHRIEA